MIRPPHLWYLFSVILAGFVLGGCDNTLEPLNKEKGIYSVYGFVDVRDEVNYIRVKNMNIPLVDDTSSTIDATVTLTDVNRGISRILEDSLVQFDSVVTHNFRTRLDIQPETTYRLDVEGGDGRTVSATTTTPGIARYNAAPTGEPCDSLITVTFKPVKKETIIVMGLQFLIGGQWFGEFRTLQAPVSGSYDGSVSYTFMPLEFIRESLNDNSLHCWSMDTEYFYVDYIHYGPDYEFGGATNVSDSLQIPGGAGQFVGLLRNSFKIRIDTTEIVGHL